MNEFIRHNELNSEKESTTLPAVEQAEELELSAEVEAKPVPEAEIADGATESSDDFMFPGSMDQYEQMSSKRKERQERAEMAVPSFNETVLLVGTAMANKELAAEAKTGHLATQALNRSMGTGK